MTMSSVKALMECMDDLGFNRNDKPFYEAQAYFLEVNTLKQGSVTFQFFSGQHSSFGPYLLFDDTVKSFGIPFTQFQPKYQTIQYDSEDKELTVIGDSYHFVLSNMREE